MIYAVVFGLISFLGGMTRKFYCISIGTILTLVIGLRDLSIGIDTYSYSNFFKVIIHSNLQNSLKNMDIECGYILLNYISGKLLGGNFQLLLLIMGGLYVGAISFVIYKYSENPLLSFLLFVGFGYFTFGMSGLRQTMAISFSLISFVFIKKEDLKFYLIFIGIAFLFHSSALIFLPAYFLNKIKINRHTLLISILTIIVFALFVDFIFDYFNSYARLKYERMATGGILFYLFLVATILLGIFYRKRSDDKNDFYYFMIISVIALWPIAKMHPAMFRLTFYYSIFLVIFIPNIIKNIKDWRLRFIHTCAYALVAVYFMTNKVLISGMQLTPYLFFWE